MTSFQQRRNMKYKDPLVEMEELDGSSERRYVTPQVHKHHFKLTPRAFVLIFIPISIVLATVGTVIMIMTDSNVSQTVNYGKECENKTICDITLKIENDMEYPIALLYEIDGIHINHNAIASSRSDKQLKGKYVPPIDMPQCEPFVMATNGKQGQVVPSGLQAASFFNDVITIPKFGPLSVGDYHDTGIAVENFSSDYPSGTWLKDSQRDQFSMWMDTPAFSGFRKLIGIKEGSGALKKGENVTLHIQNNYKVDSFNGKKLLILTTEGTYKEAAKFLGPMYIALSLAILSFSVYQFISNPKEICGL